MSWKAKSIHILFPFVLLLKLYFFRRCRKEKNCDELLVTYSVHVLVDSKVRLTAGILIIYWKVTRRTNKKKEYSECTSLGLFPGSLIVLIISHAIHVISQHQETFVLASWFNLIDDTVPLLLGTSVKLCVELIIFEFLYSTTLLSGIYLGEAPNYSCFKVFRGLCFLKQSRYLMTLEVLKIVSISILENVHWVSIRNVFNEK